MGGRPGDDGLASVSFPYNVRDVSIEWSEMETPVLYAAREVIPDSGGAGEFRGGLGQELILQAYGGRVKEGEPLVLSGSAGRMRFPTPRRGCRPWPSCREGIRSTPRCRPESPRASGTHLVEVAVPARSSKCSGLVEPERLRRHRAQCEIDRFAFSQEPVATHDLGASPVVNVNVGACHVYRIHQKGTKTKPACRGGRHPTRNGLRGRGCGSGVRGNTRAFARYPLG